MNPLNSKFSSFAARAKSPLFFILITILSLNPAAFAALTLGSAQVVGRPNETSSIYTQAVSSDKDGNDYIATVGAETRGKQPIAYVKLRKYLNNQLVSSEIIVDSTVAADGHFSEPQICTGDPGKVYLVYQKFDHLTPHRVGDLYFKGSLDSGVTWGAPQKLNSAGSVLSYTSHPTIECNGTGVISVAWMTIANPQQPRTMNIYFARSMDRGATWSPEIRIDDAISLINPHFQGPALKQVEATNYLYIGWLDSRATPQNLDKADFYFTRSTDNGATWSPNVRINRFSGSADNIGHDAYLAADWNGNVYAAWTRWKNGYFGSGGGIAFSRSSDAGATWQPDQTISTTGTFGDSGNKAFYADNSGNVYAMFLELGESGIHVPGIPIPLKFNSSSDFGQTWGTPQVIVAEAAPMPQSFSMAADPHGRLFALVIHLMSDGSGPTYVNASKTYGRGVWECGTTGCQLGDTHVQPMVQGEISCNTSGHAGAVFAERRHSDPIESTYTYVNHGDLS